MLTPTAQQEAIIERFKSGESFKIVAYAGTGKTSTLKMCAEAAPDRKILYICFDFLTAKRARSSMPSNVKPRTFHSVARENIIKQAIAHYGPEAEDHVKEKIHGKGAGFLTLPSDLAKFFNVTEPLQTVEAEIKEGQDPAPVILSPVKQIRACEKAIKKFCNSASTEVLKSHFETDYVIPDELLFLAQEMWEDRRLLYGKTKWTHDVYQKIWTLQIPDLSDDYDAFLVDEAQDSNPVQLVVYTQQSIQMVYVGDPHQSIYQFRGVSSALSHVNLPKLPLSESFRFGSNIAHAAGLVFKAATEENVPIKGLGKYPGKVSKYLSDPDAYLCRKNITALDLLITGFENIESSRPIYVAAKTKDKIKSTADTLVWFIHNEGRTNIVRPTWLEEELATYENLRELEEAVRLGEEPALVSQVLKVVSDPAERANLYSRIGRLGGRKPTSSPVLEIMTTHASKGGEWPRVQLADDFAKPFQVAKKDEEEWASEVHYPKEEELNLIYVAITRAQEAVGLGESDWIFE